MTAYAVQRFGQMSNLPNKVKNLMDMRVGLFSFFSGSGFLDLGFEQASPNYHVMFANELSPSFARVYKYNRSKREEAIDDSSFIIGSIDDFFVEASKPRTILTNKLAEARKQNDFVGFVGGPPCPDFSVAGKQRGEHGVHGRLSQSYVNLIIEQQPDFFVFENVKGLVQTEKHREFFNRLIDQLNDAGYVTD